VCLVCCRLWSVLLTEGEYCVTFSPRVVGWGLDISRAYFLVLGGLTERDSCVAESSWGVEGRADVVLIGPSREGEVEGVDGSG
jgi:hypothetical protein